MLRVQELATACADDVQRINLLAAFEAMKGCVAGGQATVTVGFAATQTAEGLAVGTEPEVIRRSVAGQVALARRDSQHRGGRHVGLAVALHTELPHTRKALEQGRISEWQATLICKETACVDPDLRLRADERLAPDLGAVGDRTLERNAARVTAELDAAAVADRSRKAARDRRVTVRPAPDTMAYLTALLPATVAVAAYAALTSYTHLVVGEGDQRGRGQIMADTLVDRLTGGMITGCDAGTAPPLRTDPDDRKTTEQSADDRSRSGRRLRRSPAMAEDEPTTRASCTNPDEPVPTYPTGGRRRRADPTRDPSRAADHGEHPPARDHDRPHPFRSLRRTRRPDRLRTHPRPGGPRPGRRRTRTQGHHLDPEVLHQPRNRTTRRHRRQSPPIPTCDARIPARPGPDLPHPATATPPAATTTTNSTTPTVVPPA